MTSVAPAVDSRSEREVHRQDACRRADLQHVAGTPCDLLQGPLKTSDPLPVDISKIAASVFVADIITMPMITPLLEAAQAKGCDIQNGVQMFDAQVDFITEYLMGKH